MSVTASHIDQTFLALADRSRRAFLTRLAEGPLSVSELGAYTDLTLAAVVQHVQVLQACGLITTVKRGRVRMCSLHPEGLAVVEDWLAQRRTMWQRRLRALGDVIQGSSERPGPTPS